MRLAGKVKGGFYPAPPSTVGEFIGVLDCPEQFSLLDPCCGEGLALQQIAMQTGATAVYGMELEEGRAAEAQFNVKGTVVGPASFLSVKASHSSFGVVWCNPPYDDEVGGGERVELSFLGRGTELLASQGIMAFVVPEKLSNVNEHAGYEVAKYMRSRYRDVVVAIPSVRPFNEVVMIGVKRSQPLRTDDVSYEQWHIRKPFAEIPMYAVPQTAAPKVFEKGGLTDSEIYHAVAKSSLWQITAERRPAVVQRPPLPLKAGHRALMLASGHLDGVIHPDGEEPHLVRGTAVKVKSMPEVEEEYNQDGEHVKTRTTIKERIQPQIRAVWPDGRMETFI